MSANYPSRDARPAARGADWTRVPERGNAFALRAMTWIALACGRRAARWLLHPITLYFMLFAPAARRQSRRYLGRALGRAARFGDGYRHVHAFTATVLDRIYLLRGRLDLFDLRVTGAADVRDALADGRGAFLFGAHVGSFEAMRAAGESGAGLPVAMLMYPDNARLIDAALRAIAPGRPPHVIELGRMGSMLAVRDWLDAGGLAGVLADRRLVDDADPDAPAGALRLPFLGQDAALGDGPFRLAALLRRPVVFMAGVYLGGNAYELRFEPLADFRDVAPAAREARIAEAMRAYLGRLEALCRAHPYNWFNFHDFWQEDGQEDAAA
jgi:predicted LPLAT superfamily acyltransferase